MTRNQRIFAALAIMMLGLLLRFEGPQFGVPLVIVKYGGSILWAMMLYCLVTIAFRLDLSKAAVLSVILATGIELFRLVHFDWLDHFRLTLAGALLLGRIFSIADIVAYAFGIGIIYVADNALKGILESNRSQ